MSDFSNRDSVSTPPDDRFPVYQGGSGASGSEQDPLGPKPSRVKKIWLLALPLCLALLVGVVLFKWNDITDSLAPVAPVVRAMENTQQAMKGKLSQTPFGKLGLLADALEKGSIDLGFSFTDEYGDTYGITGRIESDSAESKATLSGKILYNGGNMGDLAIYASPEQVSLSVPMFFGDDAFYGINPQKAKDEMASSVFAPDSGTAFAVDQASYDEMLDLLENMADSMKTKEKGPEISQELTAIRDSFLSATKPSERTETLEIEGQSVRAKVLEYSYTPEQFGNFLDGAASILEQSPALKTYFNSMSTANAYVYGAYTANYDQIITQTRAFAEEVRTEFTGSIIVTYYINDKDQLMRAVALAEESGNLVTFSLTFGAYPATATSIRFDMTAYNKLYDETSRFAIVWTNDLNGDEQLCELAIVLDEGYGEETATLRSLWNRKSGAWQLSCLADEQVMGQIDGVFLAEEKGFDLTMNSISSYNGYTGELETEEFTFHLGSSNQSSIEKPRNFFNLFTVGEQEMNDMIQRIGEALGYAE